VDHAHYWRRFDDGNNHCACAKHKGRTKAFRPMGGPPRARQDVRIAIGASARNVRAKRGAAPSRSSRDEALGIAAVTEITRALAPSRGVASDKRSAFRAESLRTALISSLPRPSSPTILQQIYLALDMRHFRHWMRHSPLTAVGMPLTFCVASTIREFPMIANDNVLP
jgi:hypothetical protein